MSQALPVQARIEAAPIAHGRHTIWLLMFAVLGFVLCVTQIYGDSPDFEQYAVFLDRLRQGGLEAVRGRRFESGFTLLSNGLAHVISSDVLLVSVLAFSTLLLKGFALESVSSRRSIFLAVAAYYMLRFYPLHELTQLRASMAIAFLLLAQVALWSGRKSVAVLACAVAVAFHTSAVAAVPFIFVQPRARWQAILLALMVFLVVRLQLQPLLQRAGSMFTPIELYQENGFGERPVNPVALAVLLDWAMTLYALLRWNVLSTYSRRALFVPLIGLALYYGAAPYPVLAHRLFEMFGVFWIFFLAGALAKPATRMAAAGFMLLSGGWYSYIFIFSDRIFQ